MEAYKFNVKISNDGSIKLPYKADLINREVEIFIIPKVFKYAGKKGNKGSVFIKMWTGFLSEDINIKTGSRIDYITEKYK